MTWWAQVAQHKRYAHGTLHEAPLFEVERIEHISMPRLQEKYLAELQDVAGRTQDAAANYEEVRGPARI